MHPVTMVVAVTRNGVIGRDNGLPWHLRSDLKHFKAATIGKPLIMGRKTFESIGKPLPGRQTIILTRDPDFHPAGTFVASSLEGALILADKHATAMGAGEIIIAGGGAVYALAMPVATRLVVTEIALEAEGDTRFPAIDPTVWRETSRMHHDAGAGDDAAFDVVTYEKRVLP